MFKSPVIGKSVERFQVVSKHAYENQSLNSVKDSNETNQMRQILVLDSAPKVEIEATFSDTARMHNTEEDGKQSLQLPRRLDNYTAALEKAVQGKLTGDQTLHNSPELYSNLKQQNHMHVKVQPTSSMVRPSSSPIKLAKKFKRGVSRSKISSASITT